MSATSGHRSSSFIRGVVCAAPIVVGYLAHGIPFGILAAKAGLPLWAIVGMSAIVYAGSAQFIALNILAAQAGLLPLLSATFILNVRHVPMGMSLGAALPRVPSGLLLYLGHSLTDESFGVNIGKRTSPDEVLHPYDVLGTNLTAHVAWVTASLIGAMMGNILPLEARYVDGALPVMFAALLAMQIKGKREVIGAVLAMMTTWLLGLILPGKWPFLCAALIVPTFFVWWDHDRHA